MEKASSENNIPLNSSFDVFSLEIVLYLKRNISRFLPSKLNKLFGDSEAKSDQKSKNLEVCSKQYSTVSSNEESDDDDDDDDCLLGSDLNMIMERLGFKDGLLQGEDLQKKWGCSELSGLFEEEPSLDEVKEAFDVYDQNRDGFIDAEELQRVLGVLGLRQGINLHECRNMVRAYDQNNDGKIDFNEFVKFMLRAL